MRRYINYFTFIVFLLLFVQSAISAQVKEKPDPDEVIKMLQAGNERFYSDRSEYPNTKKDRIKLAGMANQADYAYATVLACSDSRVPVELIFDAGVMDLFVIRVAGNVCNTDEIGSIEYGMAHVKTPLLVVLGHNQCGAVTAVTHELHGVGHKLERNIPPLVNSIIPAVKRAMVMHSNVHGNEIIPFAIEENVWQGINNLFMNSPAVRNLVREKKAMVAGAIYNVGTGKVEWLPLNEVDEILKKVEASPDKETEVYHE